jgi:hypothetical protein
MNAHVSSCDCGCSIFHPGLTGRTAFESSTPCLGCACIGTTPRMSTQPCWWLLSGWVPNPISQHHVRPTSTPPLSSSRFHKQSLFSHPLSFGTNPRSMYDRDLWDGHLSLPPYLFDNLGHLHPLTRRSFLRYVIVVCVASLLQVLSQLRGLRARRATTVCSDAVSLSGSSSSSIGAEPAPEPAVNGRCHSPRRTLSATATTSGLFHPHTRTRIYTHAPTPCVGPPSRISFAPLSLPILFLSLTIPLLRVHCWTW